MKDLNAGTLPLYLGYALGAEGTKARAEIEAMAAEVAKVRARKPAGRLDPGADRGPRQGAHDAPVPSRRPHPAEGGRPARRADGPGRLGGGGDLPPDDPDLPTTGRRLAYAKRLTDGTHPLVARVLVNRVWMHHFGRGIVGTPGDFGTQGERPTHPELLDWLADEFMAGGWRLKRLHKLIMTSTAYRQSSRRDPRQGGDRRRRPALLAGCPSAASRPRRSATRSWPSAAGSSPAMFGAPVPVSKNEVGEVVVGVERKREFGPTETAGGESRRSLYVQVRRSQPPALLETFDAPSMEPNCELRTSSTVTPQALLLMNSRFVLDQARRFAERVRREAGDDPRGAGRPRLAAGARPPSRPGRRPRRRSPSWPSRPRPSARGPGARPARRRQGRAKDKAKDKPPADPALRALAALCQTLLGSNAFLYVD